ncbi:MAG: sodium/glutamate symporter [Clostridia bacterium]|nr:sodium/glutamate symporter [Deltaproteobacteria bacterium]
MTTITLTEVQFLALACAGVLLGTLVKKRFPVFDRFNIPAPIIGGFLYAIALLAMHDRILNVHMGSTLKDVAMVTFFTTVGMGASISLMRRGGVQVLVFFAVATVGVLLQDLLGIGLAKLLGVSPLLGIVTASVALTGGPATALAFGQWFEERGVAGASVVGVASAMAGITAGGLLGGYLGGVLINRRKLVSVGTPFLVDAGYPTANLTAEVEVAVYRDEPSAIESPLPMHDESEAEDSALLRAIVVVAIAMGVGSMISYGIERMMVVLPVYVGAMIAAAVIRNVDEYTGWFKIEQHRIDAIGNVALQIFIVMALMSLELWKLVELAGPFIIMLLAQIVLVVLMVVFLVFNVMGRDYEAAVMAGGFTGFMLGTTANAMACMDVLVKKYGPAPRAFVVVPIVGCFLIDFTNAGLVTFLANLFR